MQAAWQALQPMQRDTSISFPTSIVLRAEGGEKIDADRLRRSVSCVMASSYAF
jgi:hypothetical protein